MVKVLIVEDSPVIQKLLEHILAADSEIEVVGIADTGERAIDFLNDSENGVLPDVITMDIVMPGIGGLETIRRIMERKPFPIIVVSSNLNRNEVDRTFDALNAGAITVLETPPGFSHPEHHKKANELIQKVKLLSGIKMVTRHAHLSNNKRMQHRPIQESLIRESAVKDIKLVAIGASTGGPVAIKEILSRLTIDFPVPVLIIQHIAEGFSQGLAAWLDHHTPLHVQLADQYEKIYPRNVYMAPDNFHMGIVDYDQIFLKRDDFVNGLRPSVSYLFRSIADVCAEKTIGVLLSGMGADGSEELKLLKDRGAVTIAQDEESSVVFGMPGKSIEIGGAQFVLSPEEIAGKITSLVCRGN